MKITKGLAAVALQLAMISAVACLPASAAFAQAAPAFEPARTALGRPDFQGVWASRWLTPVERIAGVETLVVGPDQAAKLVKDILDRAANPAQLDPELAWPEADSLAIVRGEHRTSLIVSPANGKLPFTDAGRAAMRKYVNGTDGPEQRMTTERCLGGVSWAPLQIRTASMLRQIVQTPAHIVIHSEAYSDLRVIGVDTPRLPSAMTPPGGDSVGRWEGDALVVETTNLAPHLSTHGIVTVLSPHASITERFELASPDELVYRYTITDPAYYAQPWTAEYSLTRSSDQMYEFACHEGNYSMTHMLAGARREDRLAATK